MTSERAPEWTDEEFATLLAYPHLSAEELAGLIAGRTKNAIGWVRGGVHSFHFGLDNDGILSRMMLGELANKRGLRTCANCHTPF